MHAQICCPNDCTLCSGFLQYLDEWEKETADQLGLTKEKQRMCISKETLEGLRITGEKHRVCQS